VHHLECPLATLSLSLSLARRVHLYISKQGKNLTRKTMNETWKKSNRSYVYGRYHIRRKGQKEREERKKEEKHGNIHI